MSDAIITSVPTGLYVGGEWLDGEDRIPVVDPATESVIAEVAAAGLADADRAADAAARAGPAWRTTPLRDRAEILRRAFDLLTARREEFATIISREEGKTRAEALGEVAYAAEFFRWYASASAMVSGTFCQAPGGGNDILVEYTPVGVALLVTPWNFPAAMVTRKIAPALAAGCTVILKPASETPLTALALAALLEDAGVPPGVVNVLPTTNSGRFVAALLADDRVSKLSFTGSTEVGRLLLAEAAKRVVNCSMELGGNAPFVVLDDADLDLAVDGALVAKMRNAGESCIGANRFYVHESLLERFSRQLAQHMGRLQVGPGLEDGVDVGPLVNAETRDKVEELTNDAVARGGRLLTGGKRPGRSTGYFFEPTVLTDLAADSAILATEIFGPVAPIVAFSDVDEVIDQANSTIFGLAAYVFGRNAGRALEVARAMEAGVVGVNRGFVSDPAAPFGGVKQSGLGREGSVQGVFEFLEARYMAVSW